MPIVDSNGPLPGTPTPLAAPPKPSETPRARIYVEVGILVVLLMVLGVVIYIKFIA